MSDQTSGAIPKTTSQWVTETQVADWKTKQVPLGLPDLVWTVERLWKIARAAKRWTKAPSGAESVMREDELVELLKELPSA